jgi:hypothetical protein
LKKGYRSIRLKPKFSQIGKFVTVYCRTDNEATILAEKLLRATEGLPGPDVPFDEAYKRGSCVSYRYGAFYPIITSDNRETFLASMIYKERKESSFLHYSL